MRPELARQPAGSTFTGSPRDVLNPLIVRRFFLFHRRLYHRENWREVEKVVVWKARFSSILAAHLAAHRIL